MAHEKGLFAYIVKSDRDVNDENGTTYIYFDGNSGTFVSLLTPSEQNAGLTLTMWLGYLAHGQHLGATVQNLRLSDGLGGSHAVNHRGVYMA